MSIRDQGYQRYTGTRTAAAARWTVVLRATLRQTLRQPWVVAILIISIFPALIGGVVMYFAAKVYAQVPAEQLAQMGVQDPGSYVFLFQVRWYGTPILCFLMAMFAGAGTVADDIRMNAFQFYFARPLSREQYYLGKLLPAILLVFFVAFLPPFLLAAVRIAIAKDGGDVLRQSLLVIRALGLATLEAIAMAVPAVAMSSISSRKGLVQGGYAALFMLPWVMGAIVGAILRSPWPNIAALPALLEAVGGEMYGYKFEAGERVLPWLPSLIVIVLVCSASAVLLRRRLASVEVVQG